MNYLIYFLKSNNYYLNLVQYHNIEANVITFVSIKEGTKILKGIKYELSTNDSPPRCNIENVIKMRSKLLWLKMIFDQLFIILEEKQPSVNNENHQTSNFLKLVDLVLDTLSISSGTKEDAVKDVCLTVSFLLDHLNHPTDKMKNIDQNDFNIYYFIQPVFHLYSLC